METFQIIFLVAFFLLVISFVATSILSVLAIYDNKK